MKKIYVISLLVFFLFQSTYAAEQIGNKQITITCTGVITIDQIDTNGQRFFKEEPFFDDYELSFQDSKPLELYLANSNVLFSRFPIFLTELGSIARGGGSRDVASPLKINNTLMNFSTVEHIKMNEQRNVILKKSDFKMTLSTGNMSGFWIISLDGGPDVKPKLTAKCNNTLLIQKQLSYASNNSSSNEADKTLKKKSTKKNNSSRNLLKKLLGKD